MSVPTASQLALLETQPHQTKLWLSIYQPQVALACQVNDGTITKGARTIAYDTVTQGSYQLVESGFILLVGTSAGGDEKGRVRVRSATSAQLVVAENSHINWADGDYLTVLRYVEILPIFTRIIQDPADELNVIFYKDYDVAYTNQNSILGAFVNIGCHYAGWLDENGQCQVYYTASGTSHCIAGTTLAHQWWFQGASSITGSTTHTPGYVTYTQPGHYVTRYMVSGSNGSNDISYRFVSIYGNNTQPITSWEMTDIAGSRETGAYKASVRIRTSIPESTIRDNALVVVFAEDYYGNTKQSIGGNALNRSTIRYVGYIVAGTIQYNFRDGWVEFDLVSATEIMSRLEGFSVSVESKASPTTWYELINMNCKRALYHYLKWHSTVLLCTDFEFSGTDQDIQFFDADRTSLYDAINTLMQGTLYGRIVSDRQGKIWAEVGYETMSSGGTLPVNMNIQKKHWIGDPSIDERQLNDVSFIEMGGIHYDGPTLNTFAPFLCATPGDAPAYSGKLQKTQGLGLTDQNHLNEMAGNVFAHLNSRYPSVELVMAGNFTNFDIAPQELIKLNVASEDTPRGIVFSEKLFAITGATLKFDAKNLSEIAVLRLAEVVSGFDADTIVIPELPPDDGEEGGTFNTPPIQVPPFPTVTIPGTTKHAGSWKGGIGLTGASGTVIRSIPFTTEYYNTGFSLGTGSSQIAYPVSGNYLITVSVWLDSARSVELGGNPWTPIATELASIKISGLVSDRELAIGEGYIVSGSAQGPGTVVADAAYSFGLAATAGQVYSVVGKIVCDQVGYAGTSLTLNAFLQVTQV